MTSAFTSERPPGLYPEIPAPQDYLKPKKVLKTYAVDKITSERTLGSIYPKLPAPEDDPKPKKKRFTVEEVLKTYAVEKKTSKRPPGLYPKLPAPEEDPKPKKKRFTVGETGVTHETRRSSNRFASVSFIQNYLINKNQDKIDQKETKDEDHTKKLTINEPGILLSIIGLSLVNGMSSTMQLLTSDSPAFNNSICQTVVPVTWIILMAFISEVFGRRPIFITLCSMSVVASTIRIPQFGPFLLTATVIHAMVEGGLMMMGMLCISEYCRPRHRFLYLVLVNIAWRFGSAAVSTCVAAKIQCEIYFAIIGIGLGLVCLGCAWAWPESPYWLATRGRREDAACTLRKLRGENAEPLLSQLSSKRRTPGPLKLVFLSLFCMLALASIQICISCQDPILFLGHQIIVFVGSSCLLLLLSILSYRVEVKIIYLVSGTVALMSVCGLALWLYFESYSSSLVVYFYTAICQILSACSEALSYVLASEIHPLKLNTVLACIFCVFSHLSHYGPGLIQELQNLSYMFLLLCTTMAIPGLYIRSASKKSRLFKL